MEHFNGCYRSHFQNTVPFCQKGRAGVRGVAVTGMRRQEEMTESREPHIPEEFQGNNVNGTSVIIIYKFSEAK